MAGLAQFLVGHVLNDRYRLESVLEAGGFGVVLRAVDLRDGREVAVKVLDPPRGMSAGQLERLRHRFQHEAQVAARLPQHPNLVPVLDFGSTAQLDYLVMELLRGESLRDRLARPGPVPLRTVLRIVRDAALGVAAGHQAGLVHRDLKPGNIYLEGDPEKPAVRVLDFGIAKMLDEDEGEETRTHLTLPGEWFGSEFYSPPEHLRREPVTRASDVYSLGVVAFELLARTRLFTAQDQDRRRAGLEVPIPSLAARNSAVPREVEWIVRKALADDPAERFETAGEMAAELHGALVRLRRATDLARDASAAAAGEAEGTEVAVDAAPRRRGVDAGATGLDREMERLRWKKLRRRALQGAAVAALAVGGVATGMGVAAMRQTRGPTQAVTPPRVMTAVEENDEGRRRFRMGEFLKALEHFERAVQKTPEDAAPRAEYLNNRAYALFRAGRREEALSALQDVVARHPRREVAYSNLAEAQLATADTAGAIATMQALLSIDPSPARRDEALALLSRLGADDWDTAEWEDTRASDGYAATPAAPLPWDAAAPADGETEPGPVIDDDGVIVTGDPR